ncbi:hypothetical protein CEXT_138051 [Caerostris extrusa]|uniref:Uncharacterized protein n=1 Tax=Caerostris extrusa TaxID=172846 RepID=A0AAV4MVL3_CAEEX|nr:hypothetical protein CEXT_138051 [Caerostris extrusa]
MLCFCYAIKYVPKGDDALSGLIFIVFSVYPTLSCIWVYDTGLYMGVPYLLIYVWVCDIDVLYMGERYCLYGCTILPWGRSDVILPCIWVYNDSLYLVCDTACIWVFDTILSCMLRYPSN